MSLIIILICIGVQRYLQFNSYNYQLNWLAPYYRWMSAKFDVVTKGHPFVGWLILVVPALLIVGIVFALVANLLTIMGYFILSLAFLWYLLDARDVVKHPYEEASAQDLFTITYQRLFAVIIWYFVFGPVGLTLYIVSRDLTHFLSKELSTEHAQLKTFCAKALGVFDWVPVRLLGLSFALVGHFGSVFKPWMAELFSGIKTDQQQVIDWGLAALQVKDVGVQDVNESEHLSSAKATSSDPSVAAEYVLVLIDRSLLVWLVAMALITIGVWIG